MPNPDSSIEFRTRDPLGVTADDTSAKLAEVRAELAAVVAEFKSVISNAFETPPSSVRSVLSVWIHWLSRWRTRSVRPAWRSAQVGVSK